MLITDTCDQTGYNRIVSKVTLLKTIFNDIIETGYDNRI